MKIRETPYAITPINRLTGTMAPAMYIYANDYEAAVKEAKQRSTLFKRFPDKWTLL